MKQKIFFMFIFLLFTIMISGCVTANQSSGDESEQEFSPEEQENQPSNSAQSDDDTLTIAVGVDMDTFDIHDHNNTLTEAMHINMFNYLFMRNDETGEIEPDLVDKYENKDDLTWNMTLKEGVTFHNGDELTAEDVKYTLERVIKDESLTEHAQYNQIDEINIIDDHEFEIVTHEPEPVLLNRLSRIGSSILPKDYIEENGWDHFLEEPIGTGPFQFEEWNRDSQVVFSRYDEYFEGAVEDWEQLVFQVIPETSTAVGELLTGGVDIVFDVPDNEWERINGNEGTSVVTGPSQRVGLLGIRHTEDYPTSDPLVREAIELAIDNEALVEHVLGGAGVPTRTRVTPGNFGANKELFNTSLYDPEKAKELLEEAGYEDGLELTLHAPIGRYTKGEDMSETVAAMLGEVGITVNVDFMEFNDFLATRRAGENEDMFFAAFGNSLFDGDVALDVYRSERSEGELDYENEDVDRLLEEASSEMDPDVREEKFKEIQEIVAEERPHVFLYLQDNAFGVTDGIDFRPRQDEMFYAPDITKQ
ncbi:ABC transporter substrate-binding protein [Alteribacillus bidgolensis]|uniref:Peptide/nickel transport system substrate-binding protein n=1 Tax=Alteribacillus bidgolensis TaxID=930129 RepID=A0A1G8K7T7_9BACI|nr:ABC transporter substrate-binding protein [Alteribacillus bidgolensis]SDI39427.1 peptide/nickel transport system substrate-binding protein [Alteribacillus bidgolensis]